MGQFTDHYLKILSQILFPPDSAKVDSLTGGMAEQSKGVGYYIGPVAAKILPLDDSFSRSKENGLGHKPFEMVPVNDHSGPVPPV